jgi:hypothetical protein
VGFLHVTVIRSGYIRAVCPLLVFAKCDHMTKYHEEKSSF